MASEKRLGTAADYSRHALSFLFVSLAFGCSSTLSDESRQRLDGAILYGWVNRVSSDNVKPALNSEIGKQLCSRTHYAWCTNPDRYTYVSVMFMNTYWGGLKGVGVYAPAETSIQPNDIVVVRFNASSFSELVRVASRGERAGCRWVGGGLSRTTTSGGVVCEDYDWRNFAPLFRY